MGKKHRICPICNQEFTEINKHYQAYHSEIPLDLFLAKMNGLDDIPKCPICGKNLEYDWSKQHFFKSCRTPECQNALRKINRKEQWTREGFKERLSQAHRHYWSIPGTKEEHSRKLTEVYQNPEVLKKVSEGVKRAYRENPEFRERIAELNFSGVTPDRISRGRVYCTRVDHPKYGEIVKIGIGNPWRRWKCISLIENCTVTQLYESPLMNFPGELERYLQNKFMEFRTPIEPSGRIRLCINHSSNNFESNNGSSEWFNISIWDDLISEFSSICEVKDTTEDYFEYWKSNTMEIVS